MADITVTAASVVPQTDARLVTGTAGASVTVGDSVYKDTADSSKWKQADSDAQASAVAGGIACNSAEDEQPIVVCTGGDLALGTAASVTIGTPYVVSSNAGGIAPFADMGSADWITHLGIGTTNTTITVDIQSSGVAIS